mgnify:CR=1 FL=1
MAVAQPLLQSVLRHGDTGVGNPFPALIAPGVAGATFVDPIAEGWFVGRPELIGADGVHPTDAGHQYLADKIAPLIGARLPARL